MGPNYGLESAIDPKLKPTFLKIKSDYLNKQTRTDLHKETKTKNV